MSIARFRSQNHPQQTGKRGAVDDVDDRGTDQAFIEYIEARFGPIDLDAAAARHNAKAMTYYTVAEDGLAQPWWGFTWCNPPYSDCGAWVRKAWREFGYFDIGVGVKGGRGETPIPSRGADDAPDEPKGVVPQAPAPNPHLIVMLLPANRVEQAWWQEHVEPYRDRPGSPLRVEFLRGRMRFDRPDWTPGPKGDRPPFGCCLLIWGGAA